MPVKTEKDFVALVKRVVTMRGRITVYKAQIDDLKEDIVPYVVEKGVPGKPNRQGEEDPNDKFVIINGLKVYNCLQERVSLNEDGIKKFYEKISVTRWPKLRGLYKRKFVLDEAMLKESIKSGLIKKSEVEKYKFFEVDPSYRLEIDEVEAKICHSCGAPVMELDNYCADCGEKQEKFDKIVEESKRG